MRNSLRFGCAFLLSALAVMQVLAQSADESKPTAQRTASWKDPADGWLDLSKLLDKRGGFFPVVMPITEPAVGYGLAAFPIFLRARPEAGAQGYARPNISTAGWAFHQ